MVRGSLIRCKDNGSIHNAQKVNKLTVGKIYKLEEDYNNKGMYVIKDDNNEMGYWFIERFELP